MQCYIVGIDLNIKLAIKLITVFDIIYRAVSQQTIPTLYRMPLYTHICFTLYAYRPQVDYAMIY